MDYTLTDEHAPPDCQPGAGNTRTYPFRNMEIGQSFDSPLETVRRVRNAAVVWGRRNGKRFVTRRADGVARCWRIA